MRIRTIIADDQLLARESLRRMLREERDIEIIGVVSGGRDAVTLINQEQPDLVFLDVQMPDLDGFGVLRHLTCPRPPAVIFVSASEQFALKAFEVDAVDYILKPCAPARLKTAVHRARELLHNNFFPVPAPEVNQDKHDKRRRSAP